MIGPLDSDLQALETNIVGSSGLFDRDWYLATYPEVAGHADPLTHFCKEGGQKGFQANPYFDPAWYTNTYGAEFLPGENPLIHYMRRGERENAWPSPHFDPEWYRDRYELGEHESPLRHYLVNRFAGGHSPLPVFDVADYTQSNPECLVTRQDPYLHWLNRPNADATPPAASESPLAAIVQMAGGSLEDGNIPESLSWETMGQILRLFIPILPFDDAWYCRHYPDVAAAVKCGLIASAHEHFIHYGFFEGRSPGPAGNR